MASSVVTSDYAAAARKRGRRSFRGAAFVLPYLPFLIVFGIAPTVYALDHRTIVMDEPAPRALLMLLDGSRDRATLAAAWEATGYASEIDLDQALRRLADLSLLAE